MPHYSKIKRIHGLLPDMVKQDSEMKGDLVEQFTKDHHKRSCTDLTNDQADALIERLSTPYQPKSETPRYSKFDFNNGQHKYILSMCYSLGWVKYHPLKKRNVADLQALGTWIEKYGYLKKPLMSYTAKELPKLVTQLENVLRSQTTKK